jgi:hypothetical protein
MRAKAYILKPILPIKSIEALPKTNISYIHMAKLWLDQSIKGCPNPPSKVKWFDHLDWPYKE